MIATQARSLLGRVVLLLDQAAGLRLEEGRWRRRPPERGRRHRRSSRGESESKTLVVKNFLCVLLLTEKSRPHGIICRTLVTATVVTAAADSCAEIPAPSPADEAASPSSSCGQYLSFSAFLSSLAVLQGGENGADFLQRHRQRVPFKTIEFEFLAENV